jgi:ABC-type lipoprotein export system ATPase subunit
MIELDRVSKVYPTRRGEVRALRDLSLRVEQGEYVAVCGPSGCGKSTLLALVGGLAVATSGRVGVGSKDLSTLSSSERAQFRATQIGFVFQVFHLLPFLNVLDNVLLAAQRPADSATKSRAETLITQFGLAQRTHHRPGQLSVGERQRVAMARALLNQPQILLADEPTGNLDPDNAAMVLDQVDLFHRQGGTVMLVTHEPPAAARAQRVIALRDGQLAAHGQ